MKPDTRAIIRAAILVVAVIAVAVLVAAAARALLLLFAALLAALTLRGAAELVSRRTRAPYAASLAAIVALLVGATVAAIVLAAPRLYEQAEALARELPETVRGAAESMRRTSLGGAMAGRLTPEPAHVAAVTRGALSLSVEVLVAMVFVFFVGVFGAAQPAIYANVVLQLFPVDLRPRVSAVLFDTRVMLTRWLLGRMVAMTFMGLSAWVAFEVLEVPLAGLFALLTGLLAFVEYAGAVASAIPPMLFALAESPKKALMVGTVYTVLHVIEGYVLTPLLARAAVRVPPALVLAGQVVLGAVLGVLGLTFSTPLMVVGITAIATLRRLRAGEERPSRRRLSLA